MAAGRSGRRPGGGSAIASRPRGSAPGRSIQACFEGTRRSANAPPPRPAALARGRTYRLKSPTTAFIAAAPVPVSFEKSVDRVGSPRGPGGDPPSERGRLRLGQRRFRRHFAVLDSRDAFPAGLPSTTSRRPLSPHFNAFEHACSRQESSFSLRIRSQSGNRGRRSPWTISAVRASKSASPWPPAASDADAAEEHQQSDQTKLHGHLPLAAIRPNLRRPDGARSRSEASPRS